MRTVVWHYRVGVIHETQGDTFGVIEYYDMEEEHLWTGFIEPRGDTLQELREDLECMLRDITNRPEEPIDITEYKKEEK